MWLLKFKKKEEDVFNKNKQFFFFFFFGETSRIDGHLLFSDGLRIDGTVVGNVNASKGMTRMLVISETASVTG